MKSSKLIGALTSAAVMIQSLGSIAVGITANALPEQNRGMRDITTMELVRDMGVGINLGNTMEACGDWIAQWGDGTVASYETAWGSPVVTHDMIKGYADEGFGVVRIPVAWSNMMGDNYTISSAYMERVQEIVDWVLEEDMYAVINIHYDNGWVNKLSDNKEEGLKRYTSMWEQICEGFKDYDDYLMFESQNEELGWDSLWNRWGGTNGKAESYALVNEVNQIFVDTVRSSGGNNAERHLLISGYNTDIELTCDSMFVVPSDPMDRCAVSVHYYTPAGFAILEEDADWAKMRSTWGTSDDYSELNRNMDLLKTTFIDKGVPVIIGEYGCPKKNKDADSVRTFLTSVCKAAYERQICPIMWDITELHYDRTNCKLYDSELKKNFNEISGFDPESKNSATTTTTITTTTTTTTTTTETTATTTTTATTAMVSTETTSNQLPQTKAGDANDDGEIGIADAVIILQSISNPDKYTLSAQGKANADVSEYGDGVTAKDALVIQQVEAGVISAASLPLYK